jgi:hypothetical protein
MSSSSFSKRIWEKVKVVAEKNDPKNWLSPSEDSIIACHFCGKDDLVLMKCSKTDCKQHCCVECAYKAVDAGRDIGLALYGATDLKVECSHHFKSVLYCTCRAVYSDSEEMVLCDSCDAWFHVSCVGWKMSNADKEFTCPVCVDLKKAPSSKLSIETRAFLTSHKIPIPSGSVNKANLLTSLKAKTKADDEAFQAQTDAHSVVGALVKLAERMEVLEDVDLAVNVRREFGGAGETTEEQLDDAMLAFSSPPWVYIMTGFNAMDVDGGAEVTAIAHAKAIADLCDIGPLLQEHRMLGISFQTQLADWHDCYNVTLRGILGVFAGVLKGHRVPVTWIGARSADSDASLDDVTLNDSEGARSLGFLFDVELGDKLGRLNDTLQALVGVGGDKRVGTRGALDTNAPPLPVRPTAFDTLVAVAKAMQCIVEPFKVKRSRYCGVVCLL